MSDPFDEDEEERRWREDEKWGCCFPGECLVGYTDHRRKECCTAEMEEQEPLTP